VRAPARVLTHTAAAAHLQEEALLANGVRAKHKQRRRQELLLRECAREAADAQHLSHNLRLQREAVLWRAVRGVQVQDAARPERAQLRAALEQGAVVAAVAAVQHGGVVPPLKEHHDRARTVVCWQKRHGVA
jgi:hypothetical protein